MFAFAVLVINKETRMASSVFLLSYLIYYLVYSIIPDDYYYHFCAILNLCIGLKIIKKHLIVGLLSFLLIPTNFLGLVLYTKYYDPLIYANIALTIIFLQIITLTLRAFHGMATDPIGRGRNSNFFGLLMVWVISTDSMAKDKKTMEKVA